MSNKDKMNIKGITLAVGLMDQQNTRTTHFQAALHTSALSVSRNQGSHISIHPFASAGIGAWEQQPKQRNPDLPLPGRHLLWPVFPF